MKIDRIVDVSQGEFEFSIVKGNKSLKCLVPSPFEVHTQIFELPKIRKEHLSSSIIIRLKSMYPGDLGECEIDNYRPYPVRENTLFSVTTFVAPKKKTASAWETERKIIPTCSISVMVAESIAHDIDFCIIVTQNWMDIFQFEHKHPVSEAISAGWKGQNIDEIINNNFGTTISDTSRIAFVTIDDISAREVKNIQSRGHCQSVEFSKSGNREIERLLELEIFRKSKKEPFILSRKATVFMVAANVLLGGLWLGSSLLTNEKELVRLHAEYDQSTKNVAELINLRKRLQAEQSTKDQKKTLYIDYYSMIAQLTSCIGNAYIRTLTINEYSFQLTAEADDSIRAFSGISESPYFRNVILVQSAQSIDKTEVFTITGELFHDSK